IDYGLSVVSRDLIAERVAQGAVVDLADLFRQLSIEEQLAGFEISQRFFEVGSEDGIADFAAYVAETGLCPPRLC
ncbi:MAG: hypothetical protein WBW88_12895, partial [Rhodothermales bacterium]